MKQIIRFAIIPAYVLLCLIIGGSAQGMWNNGVLQVLGIAILAWAFLGKTELPLTRAAKGLAVIAGLTIILIILQLVRLPPAIWTALPGRAFVSEGFTLMGLPLPWLPISLAPYETMATSLTLIPPLAVLWVMLLTGTYRNKWLAITILAAAASAVLIGALQVASADPVNSPWYFYRIASYGAATGFFANSNHMAALLVSSIPILFALVRDLHDRSPNAKGKSAILLMAGAGAVVLVLGISLNKSLAILLLGPPVVLVSTIVLFPRFIRHSKTMAGIAALSAVIMVALYFSPLHDRLASDDRTSFAERQEIWSHTTEAIADFMPLGSGLSSFRQVYSRYENPSTVSPTQTPHAHNDYLEIALETGLPGIILVFGFFLWWMSRARSIWLSASPDPYSQAATIVTGALLLHSIVDYPLRTAALSVIMAAFVAVMARPRHADPDGPADLWPTRHAKI